MQYHHNGLIRKSVKNSRKTSASQRVINRRIASKTTSNARAQN